MFHRPLLRNESTKQQTLSHQAKIIIIFEPFFILILILILILFLFLFLFIYFLFFIISFIIFYFYYFIYFLFFICLILSYERREEKRRENTNLLKQIPPCRIGYIIRTTII